MKFDIRFYLVAILFIIFDLEVAFLFPWAVAFGDLGWYGFWFADHYMPNTGSEAIEPGDVHECWAMLSAIAAVTGRIRVGPLVAWAFAATCRPSATRAVGSSGPRRPAVAFAWSRTWQIRQPC